MCLLNEIIWGRNLRTGHPGAEQAQGLMPESPRDKDCMEDQKESSQNVMSVVDKFALLT